MTKNNLNHQIENTTHTCQTNKSVIKIWGERVYVRYNMLRMACGGVPLKNMGVRHCNNKWGYRKRSHQDVCAGKKNIKKKKNGARR